MDIRDSNSTHSEGLQFYQHNIPRQQPTGGGGGSSPSGGIIFGRGSRMTESTVVTTTVISASSPAGAGGDRVQQVNEGRVGKAVRRRSRASRKAPTTVLNTDTANFRAIVQQFTGVPSGPFQAGYPHMVDAGGGGLPATLSFGLTGEAAQLHQPAAVFPLGVQQQRHERALFALGGAGNSDIYLRELGGDLQRGSMDAAEGFLLESIPSARMMSRLLASTDSSTPTNGFLM